MVAANESQASNTVQENSMDRYRQKQVRGNVAEHHNKTPSIHHTSSHARRQNNVEGNQEQPFLLRSQQVTASNFARRVG